MGKILLFISMAVMAVTAVLGFLNKDAFSKRLQELAETTESLETKNKQLEETATDLKSTKENLSTVTAEKEQALSRAQEAEGAVTKANSKISELEGQVSQKAEEISKLTADISAKEDELAKLKEAAGGSSGEVPADIQAQLQEKETLITKLQGDLDAAKTSLATLQKKEADRQALKMRDGLQGKILAVNQAWNFVVLNLGDKNGVVNNAEMFVKRGSNLIGKVRITSVEPATSIADIIVSSLPPGVSITPGDQVIFQAVQE